jgi:hypothetical protein
MILVCKIVLFSSIPIFLVLGKIDYLFSKSLFEKNLRFV